VKQRYLCRDCGFRFSESNLKLPVKVDVAVESRTLERAAGATETLDFAFWLKKQNKADSTILLRVNKLKQIQKAGIKLDDVEAVQIWLTSDEHNWSDGTKLNFKVAYGSYLKFVGKTWQAPDIHYETPVQYLPKEANVDTLINGSGKVIGCFLQGLKDTAADPSELAKLRWIDVDFERKEVSISFPCKKHNPRKLPVSEAFLQRIRMMPRIEDKERVFCTVKGLQGTFYHTRKTVARNTGNPEIEKISMKSFRHWKATQLWIKYGKLEIVQWFLGHKHAITTERYIHMLLGVFKDELVDDFVSAVAKTIEEEQKLIEHGYEFVRHDDGLGLSLYRKRKFIL